jgi:hypothetical protein
MIEHDASRSMAQIVKPDMREARCVKCLPKIVLHSKPDKWPAGRRA